MNVHEPMWRNYLEFRGRGRQLFMGSNPRIVEGSSTHVARRVCRRTWVKTGTVQVGNV